MARPSHQKQYRCSGNEAVVRAVKFEEMEELGQVERKSIEEVVMTKAVLVVRKGGSEGSPVEISDQEKMRKNFRVVADEKVFNRRELFLPHATAIPMLVDAEEVAKSSMKHSLQSHQYHPDGLKIMSMIPTKCGQVMGMRDIKNGSYTVMMHPEGFLPRGLLTLGKISRRYISGRVWFKTTR